MEVLAIIPARGGSKGLPDKNILPLLGHPLIAYSIEAAIRSSLVTRIIVSTDSKEIGKIALKYGAEVPFLRPEIYARDTSSDLEVFKHALDWLKKKENYHPDLVIQLRPTSPVRPEGIIDACIERLINNYSADSLRIVTPSPITPYKMWTLLDENEPLKPLLSIEGIEEPYNEPRQRLPKTYWQIGTLDVIKPTVIENENSMSGKTILPYVLGNEFAVDIDDLESFNKAGIVIEHKNCIKFK
ncbi:cytidylyltransferase domain-containing protein [Lutimonas zeaxanthinifaciens]|uniref:acylneuraminate cytidylyltransferase family protein n=1 Tax=Lutimonas zeaxanthinifaciens TaxID=3060215 RepID=UPI00265C9D07|nr:acylneuraminate cytidylyltransferase family protein [Lutimonas sp. YSD2104]WKK67351.1 acylneuraminate cytidylyltransferase family protein [Lutimonas sp. YSD2104]